MTRALATIREISQLLPIPEADAIELAIVDGWKVVVKKGIYQPKDLAVYFEIDSWIPHKLAPFLTKPDHEPKVYNNVLGQRLRTVKLRGQVSQGLLMPLEELPEEAQDLCQSFNCNNPVSADLTDILCIQKWEPEIPAQLAGNAKGLFPSFIPKTDQPRIQNLKRQFQDWKDNKTVFQVTEKLDGSSMTVFWHPEEDRMSVCSRNLELKFDENNTFWQVAIKNDMAAKLTRLRKQLNINLALQGELCGPGIQGNKYNLTHHQFFLYDIYNIDKQEYLPPDVVYLVATSENILHVPVMYVGHIHENHNVDALLELAEAKSYLNPRTEREGLVYKDIDSSDSFKVISNKWLLKHE